MEDKTFELLEKMYSEFIERFDKVDTRFDKVDTRFDKVEKRLDKIEITLENDIKPSLQALHERAAANTDKLNEHTQRLETVENKLDYLALSVNSQDKRLEVVESSRKRTAK
jgi:tetrahydromethanopterin S-methyltransferase subunit G